MLFLYIISLPISSTIFTLFLFFFNDTATTEIYTLSLHDALPIYKIAAENPVFLTRADGHASVANSAALKIDRKSTRLNSSHRCISYAVFCLKKKKIKKSKRKKTALATNKNDFMTTHTLAVSATL